MLQPHMNFSKKLPQQIPLIVDLDGTLIFSDMLHESAVKVIRSNPFRIFLVFSYLLRGKAVLKEYLAKLFVFSAQALPYNTQLITWLKTEKEQGRSLILCTATDQKIANKIADHLDIFDEVIASNGKKNLAGKNKQKELLERYGAAGFDYAGNSSADLAVWQSARNAIVVNAQNGLVKLVDKLCKVEKEFTAVKKPPVTWVDPVNNSV